MSNKNFINNSYTINIIENKFQIKGKLDVNTSLPILSNLKDKIKSTSFKQFIIDLKDISYIDNFGVLAIIELDKTFEKKIDIINIPDRAKKTFDSVKQIYTHDPENHNIKKRQENVFIKIGESVINDALNIKFILSFIGSIFINFFYLLLSPGNFRANETINCMKRTGVDALPIVALINFLLGFIMAFMSSIQLKQFGADIYVASLVSLAMVSELGPIMTAIIAAGRSASAFAAEIGTMKISEEIDALITMGFDPITFLAIPKIFASIIVVPLLTIFANLFAITGGLVLGITMLDLTHNSYIAQTIKSLSLFEVLWGFVKSFIFAALISCIGCLRGFQVKGGASAVGNAATSAVVTSIFFIILFDSLFAVIRSYLW